MNHGLDTVASKAIFSKWLIVRSAPVNPNIMRQCAEPVLEQSEVPDILLRAIASPAWPSEPIWGSHLNHLHPMFDNFNIELMTAVDQILGDGRTDTQTIRDFARRQDNRDHLKLTIGSQFGESALPTLDVERALVFGVGAGIGDDFWLVVDLRCNTNDPPVVGNYFSRDGCDWVEIASSFSRFCQELPVDFPS